MSAKEIMIDWVCPIVGTCLSTMMSGSPMIAVWAMLESGFVGELNAFPFCAMYNMTLAFTLYGFLIDNVFLSAANFLGLAFALYYIGSVMKVMQSNITMIKMQAKHPALGLIEGDGKDQIPASAEKLEGEMSMLANSLWMVALFWGTIGIICFNLLGPKIDPGAGPVGPFPNPGAIVFGILTIISVIVFFASPLSTIKKVVETKDSSSIDPPLVICALLNCTLWTIYGIAGTGDPTVYGPNACGMVLQSINGLVILMYPRKTAMAAREDSVEVTNKTSTSIA